MTKYREILTTHVANLDKQLQKVATAMASTTDWEKDKLDILVSIGLVGKFNSDLGSMLANDAPKDVVARFVTETPAELYKVHITKGTCSNEPKTSVDAITDLVNQLEALTASTRELIKAQS